MGAEAALRRTSVAFSRLEDAIKELRLTVTEDGPRSSELAITDRLADITTELLSWSAVAVAALSTAHDAARTRRVDDVLREMGLAGRAYVHLAGQLIVDIAAPAIGEQMRGATGGHGRTWAGWTATIERGADTCRQRLLDAGEALLQCWEEVAEHARVVWGRPPHASEPRPARLRSSSHGI